MKKAMTLAMMALAGVAVMTGCASTSESNPVAEWQESRVFSSEIAAKTSASQPLTIADVQYKSVNEVESLAAPINTLAAASATLYLQVVNGVDRLSAQNEGRQIYVGIQNDIAGGMAPADAIAQMTPEDKAAYTAYSQAIQAEDQEQLIDTVVNPLLTTITSEGAKVAVTVAALKDNPELQTLTGLAALKTNAAIASDGKALSDQFADAASGAKLWLSLLMQDKEAKGFMADYPIE